MQVVVKTPRIRVEGEISGSLLRYLRSQYGEVEVIENSDDELIEVKHSDWYRSIRGTITPGENLRIYREMHGLTQDQLAERIGNISRRNISDMERGHKVIVESVAEKLADFFDVSVEKFLSSHNIGGGDMDEHAGGVSPGIRSGKRYSNPTNSRDKRRDGIS